MRTCKATAAELELRFFHVGQDELGRQAATWRGKLDRECSEAKASIEKLQVSGVRRCVLTKSERYVTEWMCA